MVPVGQIMEVRGYYLKCPLLWCEYRSYVVSYILYVLLYVLHCVTVAECGGGNRGQACGLAGVPIMLAATAIVSLLLLRLQTVAIISVPASLVLGALGGSQHFKSANPFRVSFKDTTECGKNEADRNHSFECIPSCTLLWGTSKDTPVRTPGKHSCSTLL